MKESTEALRAKLAKETKAFEVAQAEWSATVKPEAFQKLTKAERVGYQAEKERLQYIREIESYETQARYYSALAQAAKAATPKTSSELIGAGYTMAGSTTDETARRDIERDYAASGFDVAWTQLVNGAWNYYTRKQEPAGVDSPGWAAMGSYEFAECLLGSLQNIAGHSLTGHGESPVYSAFSMSRDSERQITVALSNGQAFRLTVEAL